MADLRPFPGLRYDLEKVGPIERLLAPPYDVLSLDQVAHFGGRSEHNIVHLTRPGSDYEGAGLLLKQWLADRILARDAPAMYLHEVSFEGKRRRDLIAALRLEPYESGVILPHERTHSGPKEDRLALLNATAAELEPLWFLYDGSGTEVATILHEGFSRPADVEFPFGDDEQHRFWLVEEIGWQLDVRERFKELPVLIADGHHRYETALAYSEEVGGPPDASSRFVMALLTDLNDPGLVVLPTHRALRAGITVSGGEPVGSLEETLQALDRRVAAGAYRAGQFQVLPLEGEAAVVELHRQVIDNILGQRPAEEVLVYTRDPAEAVRWVDEGEAVAAFFLGPPDLRAVLRLARAGITMPQKSTYFHPKPPSGMVMLRFERKRNL